MRRNLRVTQAWLGQLKGQGQWCEALHVHRVLWTVGYLRQHCEGFTKKLRHVPALLRKTLTYDRGNERAEHARLAERLAIRIFFADPYSPWQSMRNCAIIYPSHLELETALLLFKSKLHHEPQPVSLSRACSSNQTPQVSDLLSWLATVSRPWDPL